jgi:flavin-dependent dehydrogenase
VATVVQIYGAGLAGLVAAITLAQEGFEVHLFDQQRRVGGHPDWHPSIQTTVLKPGRTWEYIGVDLSACFERVDSIRFYRYGRKTSFTLENMYVCERGPRKGSLDAFLYARANDLGVAFHPQARFDATHLKADQNIIVATGLETTVFQQLGIPYVPVYGYRGVMRTARNRVLVSYMDACTNYDFAYLASHHGLLFALLFSRRELVHSSLGEFQRILESTEDIQFKRWMHSTGAVPLKAQLFHQGLVLAGTVSGMIDPFLLHGMSGALTSGKIAAQAFMDRAAASREFQHLARNFGLKKAMKELSVLLPLKRLTLPLMMLLDSHLQGVGFV